MRLLVILATIALFGREASGRAIVGLEEAANAIHDPSVRLPTAQDPSDPTFLQDWMGALYPLIANQTMLDISLPGTHDSMTSDLSTTVSDGSNDIEPVLAWILHEFHDLTPGNFIRNQSRTQGLNITEQLDAGIRFIDFRIMYSAGPDSASTGVHDWYCLHFMESNHKAMYYLSAAKDWLLQHPGEIVVFWLSRHGSECLNGTAQYPDVTPDVKQAFWKSIEAEFGGLLFDSSQGLLNETTIGEMRARGQRVVVYAADYEEFTGGSPLAIDSCFIDNQTGDDISSEVTSLEQVVTQFATANTTKAQDKAGNRFFLMSMAGGAPGAQIALAAEIHFLPFDHEKNIAKCAATFHLPNMTDWCPMTLMDVGLLTNYYNQIAFEKVIVDGLHLPNAIYLDAVDYGGLIRTGTDLIPGLSGHAGGDTHGQTGYAYADTVILYNVRRACSSIAPGQPLPAACASLTALLTQRRAINPFTTWSDPVHGRLLDWPFSV